MSMDPNRWVRTLPFINTNNSQEKYKLDSNRWINTLPRKDDDILILSKKINSIPKSSSGRKYSLTIIGFVFGLILVSVIKNETRNLQKEISNLQASVNTLQLDLYQTTLEHEVITSPENISRLAKEYLESNLVSYKKSQIIQLNGRAKTLTKLEKKHKKNFKEITKEKNNKIKIQVAQKIEKTKTELKKLQELYSAPKKLPGEVKIRLARKIQTKKEELKKLYSDPSSLITSKSAQRWLGIQVVKVFLGIPIVPGK